MRVAILILATAFFALSGSPLLAQRDYPATATIRGENIWLRVDAAEDTEVLAYLQRGDPIRVTGDAVPADGDAFFPIEVVETGETGWVRDLAVDPRSFTAVADLPEVVVDEPPTEETTGRNARPTGNQGTGARAQDETVVTDEPRASTNAAESTGRNTRPNRERPQGEAEAAEESLAEEPESEVTQEPVEESETTRPGYSVENPAPFDQRLSGGGAIVQLLSGRFVSEVGFSTPKGGYKYLVIETRIEGDDPEGHGFSALNFSGQDADTGAGYDSAFTSVENALGSDELSEGEYVTGTIVLEVQETAERVIVKYDPRPFDSEDLFWIYE
jgi:hypothetical protein